VEGWFFPERIRVEDLEAEARIILAWLKKDKYWHYVGDGEKSINVKGRLLKLLYQVHDNHLKREIKEELKKH